MKCLVCDFGGSSVKYALIDDGMNMEHSGKLPAPLDSKEQFVDTVSDLYEKFKNEIEGIAISLPGYIDAASGYLFEAGAYMPLYNSNIVNLLHEKCPVKIAVENDGKCAALAEVWKGALADCQDGAVVVLGSAIAGGIVKSKKIHSGRDFVAGEFSYFITDPMKYNDLGYAFMSVGMFGITYRLCKAKNLDLSVQDSAKTLIWLDERIKLPFANPDGELEKIKADGIKFFEWLSEGDADAEEVYKKFINALAVVVHSIQICFAPEKIAIGGGLSLAGRVFDDLRVELERYYEGLEFSRQLRADVVKSRFLNECNLYGAMYNYLQCFHEYSL